MSDNPYQTPDTIADSNCMMSGRFGGLRSTSSVALGAMLLLGFHTVARLLDFFGFYLGVGDLNGGINLVIGLATVIFVCMWTSKSMINAWVGGYTTPTITPGWAAGWYFIPIAFLWKPYVAVKQIWENLYGVGASKLLILSWWFCWVMTLILQAIAHFLYQNLDLLENYQLFSAISTAWGTLRFLAGVLLIMVILRITGGHKERINQALLNQL